MTLNIDKTYILDTLIIKLVELNISTDIRHIEKPIIIIKHDEKPIINISGEV